MQGNAPSVLFPAEGILGGKRKAAWSWRKEGRKEGKKEGRKRKRKERKKCLFLGQDECKTQNV